MATDPFLVVKDEVQESLSQARALFKRFEQLLEAGSADTEELDWTTKELKTSMTSIGWDLEDLAETVTIAEASPERFKLTPDDIAERKRFIENTKQVVEVQLHCLFLAASNIALPTTGFFCTCVWDCLNG
eukprot:m.273290 g.273290  ORF g.273290 m.273290 type:complete len:130 (+) comp19339_c0_seq3:236-625(+)